MINVEKMTTQEWAEIATEVLMEAGFKPSDSTMPFLQTTSSMAVVRFKDNVNRCIVATVGYCNLKGPAEVLLYAVGEDLPSELPNGAEMPLWLTVHEA